MVADRLSLRASLFTFYERECHASGAFRHLVDACNSGVRFHRLVSLYEDGSCSFWAIEHLHIVLKADGRVAQKTRHRKSYGDWRTFRCKVARGLYLERPRGL